MADTGKVIYRSIGDNVQEELVDLGNGRYAPRIAPVGADVLNGLQVVTVRRTPGTVLTASGQAYEGACTLAVVILTNSHASDATTFAFYDNTAGSGTKIIPDIVLPAGEPPIVLELGFLVNTGVYITMSGGTGGAQVGVEPYGA